MGNIKESFWREHIDGTKTAQQLAKELNVQVSTVYHASRRWNLKLAKPKEVVTEYHGISINILREELGRYPVSVVANKYGFEQSAFRGFLDCRGIKYSTVQTKLYKETKDTSQIKRTGESMDMIKTLLMFYNNASIARVFGYSRQRIQQIREEQEKEIKEAFAKEYRLPVDMMFPDKKNFDEN